MDRIKLHLGCGKRLLKGYVHVDLNKFPHVDHVHDVRRLPMFRDGSVDLIYSSHCFEYFDPREVPDVLKEWKRVLKPGGILRLAVPDFAALARVYEKYRDLKLVLGPLYGHWGMDTSTAIQHKTVYDFETLKKALGSAGFKNIALWDWKKIFTGELAGFDDYSQAYVPHMDKKDGILISLNIQGEK